MNQKVHKMSLVSDILRKIITFMPIFCKKRPLKNNTLMPIFCRKKVHPLKNTMLPCHFLQICHEKTPPFMPVLGYKNFNSVKTTLWAKKVDRISFFRIFREKINALIPIFCKKRPFSIKHAILMPIFSILSNMLCSIFIFSDFS